MIFDWGEYLSIAEYLSNNVKSQASYRSIISRSYYALYGKARAFCLNNKFIKDYEAKGRDCHLFIYNRLIEADDIELLDLANKVSALKERRQEADYDSSKEFSKSQADAAIKDANSAIQIMKDYKP